MLRPMLFETRKRAARGPGVILVVDDLPVNVSLLTQLLTTQGYRVISASNGDEALELIARDPPDLILSDVRMPKCDACDLCRAVKAAAATRLVPIVLMTGASEEADRL